MKNARKPLTKKSGAPKPLGQDFPITVKFDTHGTDDHHVDVYSFRDDQGKGARKFNERQDRGVKSGDSVTWTCEDAAFIVVPNDARQFTPPTGASVPTLVTAVHHAPAAYGYQIKAGSHELKLELQEVLDDHGKPKKRLDYILLAGVDCSDLKLMKRPKKGRDPLHGLSTPVVRATITLQS